MGNHNVGRAMGAAARAFWASHKDAPLTKEQALEVLDAAGELFRGADAEFDDECEPNAPLGRLMNIAFGPYDAKPDKDDDWDSWYYTVEEPFRARYDFC